MTTVTLAPDVPLARMRVIVRDGAGGTLTRTGPDGVPVTVRPGSAVTGDALLDDYEAPFGVPLTYRLDGATATGTLDVLRPWLIHPTDPTLSRPVTVVDDDPHEYEAPGTVLNPVDGAYPLVIHNRRTVHSGRLRLASSWAVRGDVLALFMPGGPLLLNTPPSCYVDSGWVWAGRLRRTKAAPHAPAVLWWEADYQTVAAPAGAVTQDPSNAWAAVVASHASWSALVAAHADWLDVLTTPHPHG